MKTAMIWSRVSPEVQKTMIELAHTKGITISEYIRQLIIRDLDDRSIFTSQLKDTLYGRKGVSALE